MQKNLFHGNIFKETAEAVYKTAVGPGYKIYAVEQVENSIMLNNFNRMGKLPLSSVTKLKALTRK